VGHEVPVAPPTDYTVVQEVGGAADADTGSGSVPTVANVGNPVTTIQEAGGWEGTRLSMTFGKRIRLRFHLEHTTVQRAGLAIDDVSVTAFEPCG
jgi:hypothetical protein